MDFVGATGYVLLHEKDPLTGVVTLTFKDVTETTVLGVITIESYKLMPLLESLRFIGQGYYPHTILDTWDSRTLVMKNDNKSKTEFDAI